MSSDLLTDIVTDVTGLDSSHTERGRGRHGSTLASRRSLANLDVLVLTDRRTGVLAVLMHWAGRVRAGQRVTGGRLRSVGSESAILREHWDWAVAQPWGPDMLAELSGIRDSLYEARHGVAIRRCPVCGEPVRVDRFVREHRACIDVTV